MFIPEGFSNCRFVFSVDGAPDEMGFSIGFEGPTGADAEEVAFLANEDFVTEFLTPASKMLTGWHYLGTRVTRTFLGTPQQGDHPASITGTQTLGGPPCNAAVLVRKLTALGGRKHRGRMFVPPYNLEEDQITNAGLLGTTFMVSQTNSWTGVYNAFVTSGLSPMLFHTDPATPATPISVFSVQNLAATQRRRMR